jgi:hypothetical protein
VQTRRAEALAGFRTAPSLHKPQKKRPGEDAGCQEVLAFWWKSGPSGPRKHRLK